ncbi:MAG: galactose mutarotase, partial [Armatimonadota bacterium]|nr:galactose mutarotase [Armatimonadota bacterium]
MMKTMTRSFGSIVALTYLAGSVHAAGQPRITQQPFGKTTDGKAATLYTLTNSHGVQAQITNYGGIVTVLKVPDRRGWLGDVVLGYDNLADYIKDTPYFGALIGRYGNRIANGKFTLDGKTYMLAKNNGPNHLHGGIKGFDKVVWKARPVRRRDRVGVELRYFSKNGEEGYPGNLMTRVVYWLTNRNELRIDYRAVTDKPTVLSLTHHSYFNLAGAGNGDILKHRLMINANRFTPVNSTLIPTGQRQSVRGTPFDFRRPMTIGARINANHPQLKFGNGYDHNYVLNRHRQSLILAARVEEPTSGRVMMVYTTEPGMQLYTGNFLNG